MIRKELTGNKYGSLTVIKLVLDEPGKKKKWLCRCDCGNETITTGSNLVGGRTKHCVSCGRKVVGEIHKTHGMTKTRLYYVWHSMKNRCENPKFKSYNDYGGRGITLCKEWHDSKAFFEWAMNNGYKEGLELDRIDNAKGYCPENCRFITRTENANNKRNNKIIEFQGTTKTLAEWARFYGVHYKNLSRLLLKGYSMEDAIIRLQTGDRTHRKRA